CFRRGRRSAEARRKSAAPPRAGRPRTRRVRRTGSTRGGSRSSRPKTVTSLLVRVAAVVFDMDGVLIDSERAWAEAREALARETGGAWGPGTAERMMG